MSVKNKATNKHKLPPEDLETKQTAASITETRAPHVMQCEANTTHTASEPENSELGMVKTDVRPWFLHWLIGCTTWGK